MTGPNHEDDDPATARILSESLRRAPLDEAAYARIRVAAAAEWRTSTPRRLGWTPARRWSVVVLAASIVMALAVALVATRPAHPVQVLGALTRGGLVQHSLLAADRVLPPGSPLLTGENLTTITAALVKVNGGGTLRIAPNSQIQVTAMDGITLQAGEIYVDLPPRSTSVWVQTSYGRVEHVGTQFDVTVSQGLRIRVREGQVRLTTAAQVQLAGAGTELLLHNGRVQQHTIATHGADWSWVEALEPDYSIDNRPLIEFLQWSARETGRHLQFADDRTRKLTESVRLHGSIGGLSPQAALETVLATTTLRYELAGDTIKVSSGG